MTQQRELILSAAEKLAQAVALRDTYTGKHSRRVTSFALLLGEQLRLSGGELELIQIAATLHDIGKIGIEDAILRKPGPLTPREFDIMKTHTTKGAEILKSIPNLGSALPIVRSHHERWDGQGLLDGLKGEEIPHLARLVAVANAFDAMVFDRPYRQGQPVEFAFAEIEREQGRQFAPNVVTAFLQIREKVVDEMCRLKKNVSGILS